MPSGYTSRIYEGEQVTFPEFAMGCARAFGALIEMRDEPPGVPVPEEFTATTRYLETAQRARRLIAAAEAWTDEQAEALAGTAHAASVREIEKSNAVARVRRERYEAMLAEVEAWQPPTPDHAELKKFMGDQLRESIAFDCNEAEIPAAPGGSEYRQQVIGTANRDAEYWQKQHVAEVARAKGRTEWVRALRLSLEPLGTPAAAPLVVAAPFETGTPWRGTAEAEWDGSRD
jgi:hypothetical protein